VLPEFPWKSSNISKTMIFQGYLKAIPAWKKYKVKYLRFLSTENP
jgi:hypothetical protein